MCIDFKYDAGVTFKCIEMWPSLYVAGAVLAYSIILYAFGLTNDMHLLWFFKK